MSWWSNRWLDSQTIVSGVWPSFDLLIYRQIGIHWNWYTWKWKYESFTMRWVANCDLVKTHSLTKKHKISGYLKFILNWVFEHATGEDDSIHQKVAHEGGNHDHPTPTTVWWHNLSIQEKNNIKTITFQFKVWLKK